MILKIHGGSTRPGAGVGQLRRQRGRLHRLPRAFRSRSSCPVDAGRAAAPEPLPVPGLPAPRVVPPRVPAPPVGARAGRLPLVGGRAGVDPLERESGDAASTSSTCRSTSTCRARAEDRRTGPRMSADGLARRTRGWRRSRTPTPTPLLLRPRARREIIAANLVASRLTVLYGASGVGKSSVLRAGVAHHLHGVARNLRGTASRARRRRLRRLAGRPGRRRSARRRRGGDAALGGTLRRPTRTPARRVRAWGSRRRRLRPPRPGRGVLPLPPRRGRPGQLRREFPAVVRRTCGRISCSPCARRRSRSSTLQGPHPERVRQLPAPRAPRPRGGPGGDRRAGRRANRLVARGRGASRSSRRSSRRCSTRSGPAGSTSDRLGGARSTAATRGRIETPYLQLAGRGGGSLGRDRQPESARRRDARSR